MHNWGGVGKRDEDMIEGDVEGGRKENARRQLDARREDFGQRGHVVL